MSWHTAAYSASIANTGNVDTAALTDQVLTILNNHFLLRREMKLLAAAAFGTTITRARWASPTMRYYGQPFIRPVHQSAGGANNFNIARYDDRPFVLPAGEELAVEITQGAAGAERENVIVWLQANKEALPPGNIYTVRATSTTAAVANAWTTIAYTMDTILPSGAYCMVHSEVISTNAQAHRWIFDEQTDRPGFLSLAAESSRQFWADYQHEWGCMGRFINSSLPRLEVLANGADASHTIYIDVIPLGGMAGQVTTPPRQVLLAG